eukprot:3676265-Pyramimonas_sp.AAC.1
MLRAASLDAASCFSSMLRRRVHGSNSSCYQCEDATSEIGADIFRMSPETQGPWEPQCLRIRNK